MSKVLPASCVGGIVTAELFPVASAEVLSDGSGPSTGFLVLDEEEAFYVTSNASDLKTTLEKVISALNDAASALSNTASALTSIGAGMTGPTTAPPPTLPATVALISTSATSIQAATAQLTVLKGVLK
jgi:hypothetical protein